MAALTTEFITNLLNHYFKNAAHGNVGDANGLPASATAGSLYLALHSADPGDAGNQSTGEISYTGYSRPAAARGTGFTVSGKSVSPATEASFGKRTDGGGDVVALFWSVGTDATGAGHLILRGGIGPVPTPFTTGANNAINCPAHGFAVGDRVVFWQYQSLALPGLTDGQVYWVVSAPDANTFTVSSTQGGASANLTVGQGTCQKITPLVITQNVTPKLETGTIIKFQ
jgi:hypothetical protein